MRRHGAIFTETEPHHPRAPYSREEAIFRLGILVIHGVERGLELCRELGVDESEFETLYITPLNMAVTEEDLCDSIDFSVALLIGLCNAVAPAIRESGKTSEELSPLFLERLSAIFPKRLAQRFYERTRARLPEIGAPEFPERLLGYRERALKLFDKFAVKPPATISIPTLMRWPRTETKLVPCPKCKHLKRCDKNTKKFHCKNPSGCDFKAERFSFTAKDPFNP